VGWVWCGKLGLFLSPPLLSFLAAVMDGECGRGREWMRCARGVGCALRFATVGVGGGSVLCVDCGRDKWCRTAVFLLVLFAFLPFLLIMVSRKYFMHGIVLDMY
jgi:hypothetical protein